MATRVLVKASNPGYPGRWRSGDRFFEHGVEVAMTVVEDPEGGPSLTGADPIDPTTGRSDMTKISRAGLAELKADSECFSVLEGDRAASAAALDEAISQAKESAGHLFQARSALAAAEAETLEALAENDKLKEQLAATEAAHAAAIAAHAALAAENDKLKAAVESASLPSPAAPVAPTPPAEAKPEKASKK